MLYRTPATPSADRRSRQRSNRYYLLLGTVVAAALAVYTTHKLYRMATIRGIIGDARIDQRSVASKSHYQGRRGGEVCFFMWREPDAGGALRDVQADCDYWEHKQVGDPIYIVDTGDGDVHLRDGEIYTSDGNFVFDGFLLTAELAAVIYCLRRLRRSVT